ncbi:hypothetical protein Cflav_PD3631 [Pedosphaera parvula Ellin514]|uniref:Uncharacterized protein n=1 Tax=Pedosphaera parvula (strain Ellin514) TaxID=320771 RepID=B9XHD8_PEDPL|nr:hypothetical protein Cflav_PD3631 [Pedosphaera parvula Ellin514]
MNQNKSPTLCRLETEAAVALQISTTFFVLNRRTWSSLVQFKRNIRQAAVYKYSKQGQLRS